MGIRVQIGKLFQHGLKDATPRRMSTFINTRIINPNLNPTLNLCTTLSTRKSGQKSQATTPHILSAEARARARSRKGGETHTSEGGNPQNTILPKIPRLPRREAPVQRRHNTPILQPHPPYHKIFSAASKFSPHHNTSLGRRHIRKGTRRASKRSLPHILTTKTGKST